MQTIDTLTLKETYANAKRTVTVGRFLDANTFLSAEAQDLRWHLWIDGKTLISTVCAKNKQGSLVWAPGPTVTLSDLSNPTAIVQSCRATLELGIPDVMEKPRNLGVIIHVADAFTTAIVKPNFNSHDNFQFTIETARETPADIIGEDISKNIATSQWRFLPLAKQAANSAGIAVELALTKYEGWGSAMAQEPRIKLSVRSAPIELTAAVNRTLASREEYKGRPKLYVLYYDRFSVLVPTNADGDVLDVRTLNHNQRASAPNFAAEVINTAQKENLDQCVIVLVKACDRTITALATEISTYMSKGAAASSGYEVLGVEDDIFLGLLDDEGLVREKLGDDTTIQPEMLTEYRDFVAGEEGALPADILEQTEQQRLFSSALSNYWHDNAATRESQITRGAAGLLLGGMAVRCVAALAMVGLVAYAGLTVYKTVKSEAWNQDRSVFAASQDKLDQLTQQKSYLDIWTRRMLPRSQAWSSADLVLSTLSETSDIQVHEIRYTAGPLIATNVQAPTGPRMAWERKWTIDGMATDKTIDLIRGLQERSQIEQVFNSTARRLNEPIYEITPTRSVVASVREEQNSEFNPALLNAAGDRPTAAFRFKFKVEITQSIDAKDSLALDRKSHPTAAQPLVK